MQTLVTANASALPENGIPDEIVYIPEGVHQITPSVNGKPKTITVTLDPKRGSTIAAAFQKSLELRLADNVRPIIDFDHKSSGPAAGIPKSFRYEAGKGIMLAVDWTRAGREAIEGRDFSYSSPTFLLDDDGSPFGLPERGPIAALVNHPAFRGIQRIAAADETNPINPEKQNTMKLIAAHFKLDDSRTDLESLVLARVQAAESDNASKVAELNAKIKALEEERDALKGEKETFQAEAADARKTQGEKLLTRAVAAGYVAPKDDAAKAEIIEASETSNKIALKLIEAGIAKLEAAGGNPLLNPVIVKATDHKVEKSDRELVEEQFAAEAAAK